MTRKTIQSTRPTPNVAATLPSQLAQLPHLPMHDLWALWHEHSQKRPAHHHRPYLESRRMPGTTLVREFNCIAHCVTVLPDGRFGWQGQTFKSLSGVARAITGTPWSDPVFFGIKTPARKGKAGLEVSL